MKIRLKGNTQFRGKLDGPAVCIVGSLHIDDQGVWLNLDCFDYEITTVDLTDGGVRWWMTSLPRLRSMETALEQLNTITRDKDRFVSYEYRFEQTGSTVLGSQGRKTAGEIMGLIPRLIVDMSPNKYLVIGT